VLDDMIAVGYTFDHVQVRYSTGSTYSADGTTHDWTPWQTYLPYGHPPPAPDPALLSNVLLSIQAPDTISNVVTTPAVGDHTWAHSNNIGGRLVQNGSMGVEPFGLEFSVIPRPGYPNDGASVFGDLGQTDGDLSFVWHIGAPDTQIGWHNLIVWIGIDINGPQPNLGHYARVMFTTTAAQVTTIQVESEGPQGAGGNYLERALVTVPTLGSYTSHPIVIGLHAGVLTVQTDGVERVSVSDVAPLPFVIEEG
jgi:hypothetical protein